MSAMETLTKYKGDQTFIISDTLIGRFVEFFDKRFIT